MFMISGVLLSVLIVFKVYIVSITNREYAYPQRRFVYTGMLDSQR